MRSNVGKSKVTFSIKLKFKTWLTWRVLIGGLPHWFSISLRYHRASLYPAQRQTQRRREWRYSVRHQSTVQLSVHPKKDTLNNIKVLVKKLYIALTLQRRIYLIKVLMCVLITVCPDDFKSEFSKLLPNNTIFLCFLFVCCWEWWRTILILSFWKYIKNLSYHKPF